MVTDGDVPVPDDKVVHLDVREDLRSGREPFSRIMAARQELPEDGALCVRAIFEPVPLYRVMENQGFRHRAERLADDDWRVWFFRAEPGEAAGQGTPPDAHEAGESGASAPASDSARTAAPDAAPEPPEDEMVLLDVRGLEPPEPLVRTLEALEVLPEGHTLVQINVRIPRLLFPHLEERGFVYAVREQSPGLVRVFIRRERGVVEASP